MPRPPPFQTCPPAALAGVRGVFTDIDDTLTQRAALEPAARTALEALRAARMPVIAVTGRPLGWSEPLARDWPVEAVVAENGAVMLWREGGDLCVEFAQDAAERARNVPRLRAAAEHVLRAVPGAALARDSAGRATDLAIDHAEFAHLDAAQVAQVERLLRDEGLEVSTSSIHVNGWIGTHDKRSGAAWIVRRLFGEALQPARWLYVGDSPNDQAMFAHFPLSVGVANLLDFADRLQVWPAYLADGERGAGFAEVVQRLLAARHRAGV